MVAGKMHICESNVFMVHGDPLMPLLKWKPEYSVSEPELDSHHIMLFGILNTVYENVMNSLEIENVIPAIDRLSEYAKYHLVAEAQHMKEMGYLDIDAHIEEHRQFMHKLELLKNNYHGNNLEVTQELIILLGEWLLHHVLTEDRKYSTFSPIVNN
jgi:hemerythrin-like metal-binding protein